MDYRTGRSTARSGVAGMSVFAFLAVLLAAVVSTSFSTSAAAVSAVVSSDRERVVVHHEAVKASLLPADDYDDADLQLLPKPNCSAPSELQLNDTCGPDCWDTDINPSQMFKFCRDYSTNVSLISPSPACCAGVFNASTYFLSRCFCRYVYYPAPNMGIIPARRLALPELCNVTNFCQMCANVKPATCTSPSSGKLKHHVVVLIVSLTITALVVGIIAGAISLYIWFAHRYKNKLPHPRYPDSSQPDADDMLKIEGQNQSK